ncbi:MAG TPA: FAD-dependent monooxygenase [Terracidiphilus sp.]|jgi:2-polyprenyl-6-methoxyphenol hydroxylase-like FAD-dependent oxidoreductase
MPNNMNPAVLIAGGGPTGLAAALELKRFGLPVRIVDEMEGPATTSRALAIQARTLEEMELRGLAGEFIRLGHRAVGGDIYGQGKRLIRVDFTKIHSPYNYLLVLAQSETERILREALEAEGAAIEWGVKMLAFGQHSSGITATLEHTDGSLEKVDAPYLIGAEGAHSVVRESLGLEFKGKTLDESFALGDVHVDGDLPNSDFHIFSSEQGFLGLFPMGGSEFRLVASYPASESASTPPTLEELQTVYDQRAHIPARLRQLTWSSWFHINSRMVQQLRVGHVFLAGDAAHIHSPAGAQGMNTGIQDAINLGWKMALVLAGRAPENLLDTYEQDRIPVMRSIISRTEALTDMVGGGHSMVRTLFVHLAPWIANADFVQDVATARISQIALNYRNSPISEDHFAEGSLIAGDRVPDLRVLVSKNRSPESEVRPLFSLLDPSKFTLLLTNFTAVDPPESRASRPAVNWEDLKGQIFRSLEPWQDLIDVTFITSPEGEAAKPFEEILGARASITLIRPDAYVGFRGNEGSVAQLTQYCSRWLTPEAKQKAA